MVVLVNLKLKLPCMWILGKGCRAISRIVRDILKNKITIWLVAYMSTRHVSRYVHQVVATHFEMERALIFRNKYVGLSLLN